MKDSTGNEITLYFCDCDIVTYCQCGQNYGCRKCGNGAMVIPCRCVPAPTYRIQIGSPPDWLSILRRDWDSPDEDESAWVY